MNNSNHTLALPAPELLSVNIPFQGFYDSDYSYEMDREEEQTVENWQGDQGAFEADCPALAPWRATMTDEHWCALGESLMRRADYRGAYLAIAQDYADAFCWWIGERLDLITYEDVTHVSTVTEGYTWTSRKPTLHMPWAFEELVSPREYNFTTDRIFVRMSLSALERMKRSLDAAELEQMAKDRHTSRDGFISFYSPRLDDWPEALEDWDDNQLGTLVRAFVHQELKDQGERLNDELWEGMSEATANAWSNCIDWPAVARDAEDIADELEAEARELDPDFDPASLPAPRCPWTLDLFEGRA